MKRILLTLIVVVTADIALSQQLPHYSQYMYNSFYLNPAVAGTKDYNPAILSFRSQWTGLSGAPSTQSATIHGQLMENMGVGAVLLNDKTGPLSQSGFQLAYSYHLKINSGSKLALGLAGTLYQHVLDYEKLTYVEENDLAFQLGKERSLVPDATFGAYYYSEKYYAGLSIPQLIHSRIHFTDNEDHDNRHIRHYYLTGGYKFELNEDFDLEPSVLFKAIFQAPLQVDLNAKVLYKDFVWLGTSYRHQESMVFMLGLQKNQFFGGYSYDLTLSNIRRHSSGSHEIFLGMNIPKFKAQTSPRMR